MFFLLVIALTSFFNTSSATDPTFTPRDPHSMEWARGETNRARKMLAEEPSLLASIQKRGNEIAARNPPLVTKLFDHDFVVRNGSLIHLASGGERTLVDATKLEPGSVVTEFRLSPDGAKLAFGVAVYGNDWTTWKVLRLSDLAALTPTFAIKSSGISEISWDLDSLGFYYIAGLMAGEDILGKRVARIKYHRLGSEMALDQVVFQRPGTNPTEQYKVKAFDQDRVLVFRIQGAAEVPLFLWLVKKTKTGFSSPEPLIDQGRHWGRVTGFSDREVFIRSSKLGGTYGILAVDLTRRRERTIVPAVTDSVLIQAQQLGHRFVLQYLEKDLTNTIVVTDLTGKRIIRWRPSDFQLPDRGTLSLLTGDRESRAGDFTYQAVNLPTQTLRFDAATDSITLLPSDSVPFNGTRVQSTLHYYRSRDGVRIPLQVFSRIDTPASPTFAYLHIYGNIGIATGPLFNRKFQLMLELGGVVAVANIRGGGEFGLPWQKAGTFTKWKSLEDIAAAAQWLRKEYPSIGRRLALSGRSFGGMNTMACYVYLQEHFDVFTPVVSVSDPEAFLGENGWWAVDDFGFRRKRGGDIFDEVGARKRMATWNPLRGVPKLKSPKPLLAFSGEFDLRVQPDQTTRFVEALIKRFGSDAPVYMIETEKIGHNGRAEFAEEAAFIARQFGIRELRPLR